MLFSKSTIRFIQICMFILTLLIIPLGIPLLISVIIIFILITCAVVDLVHSIYLRLKKVNKLDAQYLAFDFISLISGVTVIYISLILFTFHGVKMSN